MNHINPLYIYDVKCSETNLDNYRGHHRTTRTLRSSTKPWAPPFPRSQRQRPRPQPPRPPRHQRLQHPQRRRRRSIHSCGPCWLSDLENSDHRAENGVFFWSMYFKDEKGYIRLYKHLIIRSPFNIYRSIELAGISCTHFDRLIKLW